MKEKSIIKNIIYKSTLNLFNIVIPAIIGSYTTKTIGKDYTGEISYMDSIYQYFLIFAAFGIYNYGLREISRLRDDKEKIKKIFSSLFIIGVVSTIVVLIAYNIYFFGMNRSNNNTIFLIYMFSIFSNLFYVEWANEALEKYNFITIKTIIVKIIYIILLLILVKKPEDYLVYAGLLSLSIFLNNIISFIFIMKDIGFTIHGLNFKVHIKFLIMALIMANGNVLYTQLDRLFLGANIGNGAVALYGTPQNIISMVGAFIMSVVYVTVPRLSNILKDDDESAYLNLLNKISRILSLFLFPAAVGIFVLAKEIIIIYSTPEFLPAVPVLKIFTLYMISLGFESILTNQVIYVKRKERVLIVFILICGVLNLISKLVLVKIGLLTPVTAIVTTIIANSILILFEYVYAKKVINVDVPIFKRDKLRYLLIALTFIPISYLIKSIGLAATTNTLMIIFVCSITYFITLVMIKDKMMMLILNKIFEKYKYISARNNV